MSIENTSYNIRPIGHIKCNIKEKFGVPRQSGIIETLRGEVVLDAEFRVAEAVRELEEFSHVWLIWKFSDVKEVSAENWSPTVRPPRLGGNRHVGVFASRSPFRPNGLGLSVVRLDSIDYDAPNGPVLHVSGIDMKDGTPVLDIKPYIPYADCISEALPGYTKDLVEPSFTVSCEGVDFPEEMDEDSRLELISILSKDPRPAYQNDPQRIYGLYYSDYNIKFKVDTDLESVTIVAIDNKE